MTTSIQPGWYDDPADSNAQRYWDGQAWTPQRHRKPLSGQPPAPTPPPPPNQQAPPLAPGQKPAGPPPQRSNKRDKIAGVLGELIGETLGELL